jgi:hypothetical protein
MASSMAAACTAAGASLSPPQSTAQRPGSQGRVLFPGAPPSSRSLRLRAAGHRSPATRSSRRASKVIPFLLCVVRFDLVPLLASVAQGEAEHMYCLLRFVGFSGHSLGVLGNPGTDLVNLGNPSPWSFLDNQVHELLHRRILTVPFFISGCGCSVG